MNKTYLIVGGASVVSLAAGAAGGYFFAKKQIGDATQEAVDREVAATRAYYTVQIKTLQKDFIDQLTNGAPPKDDTPDVDVDEDEVQEPSDEEILRHEALEKGANNALINYAGMAKPELSEVASNIFTNVPKTRQAPPLPPRDDHGKFLPRDQVRPQSEPYLIDPDEFIKNTPEHDQASLFYFKNEDVLIDTETNDDFSTGKVGEGNLACFPVDEDPSVIYVRNEGLEQDYQVTLTLASLTEHMGMGESDDGLEDYENELVSELD